jgi:serine/threonine protein phosphatase PrpC
MRSPGQGLREQYLIWFSAAKSSFAPKSIKEISDQLVKWVMKRGALDNFTFILLEVE